MDTIVMLSAHCAAPYLSYLAHYCRRNMWLYLWTKKTSTNKKIKYVISQTLASIL